MSLVWWSMVAYGYILNYFTSLLFLCGFTRDTRDKTMDHKFMYISNNDKQNFPFCRLKLLVKKLGYSSFLTDQNSVKSPIDLKSFLKTLGTTVIYTSESPPSLGYINYLYNLYLFSVFLLFGILMKLTFHHHQTTKMFNMYVSLRAKLFYN